MAKGIDINGQLRGKRGGVVYYRAGGQQISRSRNFNPNNPQTMAQMLQRLALANASKASKGLKEIIDHSFEGVRYGADSVRNFESKAQLALKASVTTIEKQGEFSAYVPMDALGFPVAEFLISTGTLPSAIGKFEHIDETGQIMAWSSGNKVPTGVSEPTITPRQFCEILGVNVDSQITLLLIKPQESIGGAGSEVIFNDNIIDIVIRINFDQEKLDVPMLKSNKVKAEVLVADKSQNVDFLDVNVAPDEQMQLLTDRNSSAAAFIVSRFVDGQWRRSTEKLTIAAPIGTERATENIEHWGWNWYDEVVKTLFKSSSVVEDRLLNKEPNNA